MSGTGCDQPEGSDATSPWRVRRFDYNSLSELTRAKNPESGAINYYYNDDGILTSKVDARGITINYNPTESPIDMLHRVTKKTYTNGDSSVSYFYDQTSYNGLTITNGVGQRTGMSDSSGVSAWSYDSMGRRLAVRRTISGSTKDFTYAYDLAGSVQTLTYPTQGGQARTVNYRANALGWPKSAYETSRTYALADQADAYAPQGALGHAVLGSVVTLTNSYQNRLQPNTLSATAGGNTLMSRTYDFHRTSGNNGNVYGITDNLDALNIANRPTGSATFTYDALNRLTQAKSTGTDCTQLTGATKNWGNSYSLDPWGNLINKGVPSPNLPGCLAESLSEIVGVDNRFTGAGRYDASGNMTQNGAYVYDAENRLKTAAATTYTYDGDGNRVLKTGTAPVVYWRGAGADALAEGTSSNLTAEYIFFGGKRVARVDNPGASETVHYYISDHLGSATVIASSTGTVEKEEMYFPYGGERWANGGDGNHYKFTGKERDTETGLDYFGARYYASTMGRFLSPDPGPYLVPNPQNWNRYAYVHNNPLRNTDPSGRILKIGGEKGQDFIDFLKKKSGLNLVTDKKGNLKVEGKRDKNGTNAELAKQINRAISSDKAVSITANGGETPSYNFFDDHESKTVDMSDFAKTDSQAPDLATALADHVISEYTDLAEGKDFYDAHHNALDSESKAMSQITGNKESAQHIDDANPVMKFVYTTRQYNVLIKEGPTGTTDIDTVTTQEKKP